MPVRMDDRTPKEYVKVTVVVCTCVQHEDWREHEEW